MRTTTAQYLNKDVRTVSIRNNNASAVIYDGMPIFLDNYNVSGVYLGVDVKSLGEALGDTVGMLLGISRSQSSAGIALGEVGEAVVYGFCDAIVTRRTRAASTDSWNTQASIGAGDPLVPETVGNYLGTTAKVGLVARASLASDGTLAAATLNVSLPMLRGLNAGQSKASQASAASDGLVAGGLAAAALADTTRMKCFVRLMG